MCGFADVFPAAIYANLWVSFMAGHRNEHDPPAGRAQIAPLPVWGFGVGKQILTETAGLRRRLQRWR